MNKTTKTIYLPNNNMLISLISAEHTENQLSLYAKTLFPTARLLHSKIEDAAQYVVGFDGVALKQIAETERFLSIN